MAAHQAPLSLGFSRHEHWSGLPFPSPMHESEKWKWSHFQLLVTPWTAAYQAPPSTGFSRQEYWSGMPLPSPDPINRCQQIWKTQQWPQDWKRSVSIPIPMKHNAKDCSNYCKLHSFHMLAMKCSQSFKLGFNSMWTKNFQVYKLNFKKAKEPEIKLPTAAGS